jgi:hypothetical protein
MRQWQAFRFHFVAPLRYDSVGCRKLQCIVLSCSPQRLHEGCAAEEEDHAKYREAEPLLVGRGRVSHKQAQHIRVLLTYSEHGRARKEGFCLRNVCRHIRVLYVCRNKRIDVRVGVMGTLLTHVREMLGLNLGRHIGHPDCGISLVSSVPPGKCGDSTWIRSRPLP